MLAELIELQTLEASDDRIWCVAWNPAGTLYELLEWVCRTEIDLSCV